MSKRVMYVNRWVDRLVRRLEVERHRWAAIPDDELPTVAEWRAGYCEGLRIAQVLIRKGN